LHAAVGVLVVYAVIETVAAWVGRRQPVRPHASTGNDPWTPPRVVPGQPWHDPSWRGFHDDSAVWQRPSWWPGEHP
jgi:hypothetical protein